jgi:ABC-type sugar transport system permease subunit
LAARRRRAGILFSLPVVALVGSLLLLPIGQTVYYSFTNWDGFSSKWIGTANYSHLFHDSEFIRVVENNAMMVLAIPVAILLPLGVAFLINSHMRGWRFFRSVFFLPTAVSWVVIGYISVRFFADQGILQSLLDNTGLGFLHPNFLSHERSALVAVMITFVWSMFGTNLIIFLAGMATIDQEIYDAARVDGAGSLTVMFRITFPLLKRFVQFTFIISLITAFSALFSLIYVMTGGGTGYGTTTLEFYSYQQAFSAGDFSIGATAGVVLFAAVFAVSMLQLRLLRSKD